MKIEKEFKTTTFGNIFLDIKTKNFSIKTVLIDRNNGKTINVGCY